MQALKEVLLLFHFLVVAITHGQKMYLRICAPVEGSDQPEPSRSLINLSSSYVGQPRMQRFSMRTTKTLIRPRGCAGWFESSFGAHVRKCVFLGWSLDLNCCYRPAKVLQHWVQLSGHSVHNTEKHTKPTNDTFYGYWVLPNDLTLNYRFFVWLIVIQQL